MKVIKSVSFNGKREDEAEMIKLFKRRSFSKYIKRLIKEDLAKVKELKAQEQSVEQPYRQPQQTPNSINMPKVFTGGVNIRL